MPDPAAAAAPPAADGATAPPATNGTPATGAASGTSAAPVNPEAANGTGQGEGSETAANGEASLIGGQKTASAEVKTEAAKPFELPKDSPYAADLPAFQEAAAKLGLTKEQTNALALANHEQAVRLHAASQKSQAEASVARVNALIEQAKADKEIGGANLEASLISAKAATAKFGSPAFQEMVNKTAFGSHPEVIRFLSAIGKAMGEDTFHGGRTGGGEMSEDAMLRLRYPTMFPKG